MSKYLSIVLLACLTLPGFSQQRCATNLIHEKHYKANKKLHDDVAFEQWLSALRSSPTRRVSNTVYQIPVVLHVIHNGEEIGEGTNLSEERLLEQIQILNDDFRRNNADTVNTPSQYREITADSRIEFVLAKQDPEGLPTTGITRTQGTVSQFRFNEDELLKSHIYWPAEDYMNIYIADLKGFLGWAQFPVMNLDGLEGEFDTERLTDGVALDYQYVGINDDTNTFDSKGRSATHEIGHFLGLRHIWGDVTGCGGDDFCEDTPTQSQSSSGCPDDQSTCGSRDMIENFLDYTDDECMNLFTLCQKERMRIVLENSPRRRSLLTSKALEEPEVFALDLGIRNIVNPISLNICETSFSPQVQLRNYGENPVDSFKVTLTVNNNDIETVTSNTSVASGSLTLISFGEVSVSKAQNNSVQVSITEVNGSADLNAANNSQSIDVFIPNDETIPFAEDFAETVNSWNEINFPFDQSAWTPTLAAYEIPDDRAYQLPYFDGLVESYGNFDYLISPVIDLTAFTSTNLEFRYAYATRPNNFTDGLIVAVSTDCGVSFPGDQYIFERYGNNLATAASLEQSFSPISSNDWQTQIIDLTQFNDEENVRIAFIGVNGNGNNIYLDDISITPKNLLQRDVSIGEVDRVSLISCIGEFSPVIEIKNLGLETITSLDISYKTDSLGNSNTASYQDFSILSGKSRTFTLPDNAISNSSNILEVEVTQINGTTDSDPSNNSFVTNLTINADEESIPIRERFDFETDWTTINSEGTADWQVYDDGFNQSIYVNSYQLEDLGKENWLVSPVLSVNDFSESSLSFRVSYAQRLGRVDGLRVMLSSDCGLTWEDVVYNKQGNILANADANTEWFPLTEEDWVEETIALTDYLPETAGGNLRIAFVATNGNGNNIFVDDIEVFTTATPNKIATEGKIVVHPNPADDFLKIAVNLPQKEPVRIVLSDIMGKIVFDEKVDNALNQIFEIDVETLGGIYLLSVFGEDFNDTQKVLINR